MTLIIKALAAFCARLAFEQALRLGRRLGWFIGRFLRVRRAEVLKTLRSCFPEKSAAEICAIADGMYGNLGLVLVETFSVAKLDRAYADRHVDMVGFDHVVETLKLGRGAIMLTAHIGNFELLGLMSALYGVPLTVITKTIRPAALNAYWERTRARFGVKIVPARRSFRTCMRVLRNNELLGFILDQNMRREWGIFVDFFGRPACTSPGLALLSAHCGSPVIPIFNIRQPDGRHRVEVHAPLAPPPDHKPETIRRATQEYTAIIEAVVRAHPEQWIWLHRRWRTQPPPDKAMAADGAEKAIAEL